MIGVILCGGRGTRLNKNKKNKILKPLLKINGKPLISFIIDNFKKNGIKEIIIEVCLKKIEIYLVDIKLVN